MDAIAKELWFADPGKLGGQKGTDKKGIDSKALKAVVEQFCTTDGSQNHWVLSDPNDPESGFKEEETGDTSYTMIKPDKTAMSKTQDQADV